MAMVMPRSRSSGALSIWSKGTKAIFGFRRPRALVIAAAKVVLPWSMWPIVPTFMCSLVRSNFALAMGASCGGEGQGSGGAHDQDRTGDLVLTKDALYRLSYVGAGS